MNAAVIVAGGSGDRFGAEGGKQLAVVAGAPVLRHTVSAFAHCAAVDAIVVVVSPGRAEEYRARAVDPVDSAKVVAVVPGGSTRQRSVQAGLDAVPPGASVIIVHDGARPLVTPETIEGAVAALSADPALAGVVVGHPSYDTLKSVDRERRIVGTLDRSTIWAAQTPQVFRAEALREAYARAAEQGIEGTDDAALVEAAGGLVLMTEGPRDNIKVTVAEDLRFVERVLAAREGVGADE